MLTFLYQLIIMPLELMIEVIFTVMYRMLDQAGLAVIGVSIVVSFLMLPLYRRADQMQEEERDRQDAMKRWVDHIKRTFKGDEQYMLLTTYYRQMNYHPLYALKSSVSLFLQIPFFIAAYHYLSNLQVLQNVAFGPIPNLGTPDRLLTIGGMTINLLPVLMTAVNLVSGAVYSRGFPLKTKLQQYILTLLFLVLLYNRPAGLVLYWTMNNVFSLGKNIFLKVLKHPKKDFAILSSVCGIAFFLLIVRRIHGLTGIVIVLLIALVMQAPLLRMLFHRTFSGSRGRAIPAGSAGEPSVPGGDISALFGEPSVPGDIAAYRAAPAKTVPASLFFFGGTVLTLLAGFLIPLSVISDSPTEFINAEAYVTPFRYVLMSTAAAAGMFLLWLGVFYLLSSRKVRGGLALGYWILSVCCLINYMFFSKNFGTLSTELVFEQSVKFGRKFMALNALVMLLAALALVMIWKRRHSLVRSLYGILILGILVLGVRSMVTVQQEIRQVPDLVPASEAEASQEYEPLFRMSRTGKNVVVLMMDRMISCYVPYILNEKPELREQFSGFTWYPNTLSYGGHTNIASPALFGGYEYTPGKINERSDLLLVDKQNEALKVMPANFSRMGYEVTVCDPPWAGYRWISDLSIYDDLPGVRASNVSLTGMYTREMNAEFGAYYEKLQRRSFLFYSLFRMVPTVLQTKVYDKGRYLSPSQITEVSKNFINNYSTLSLLSGLTEVTDEDQDTFLMMTNRLTHEPTMLQMPDYEPSLTADNERYLDPERWTIGGVRLKMEKKKEIRHYCVNMATFLKLGEWFDYLREQGVYDNTRIIIVADHGAAHICPMDRLDLDLVNVTTFNPILMVKDFGTEGFTTDESFMTNGDTPYLAMKDLVDPLTNPYTGQEINMEGKKGLQEITTSANWDVKVNNGYEFDTSDGEWLSVHDDIFAEENWKKAE